MKSLDPSTANMFGFRAGETFEKWQGMFDPVTQADAPDSAFMVAENIRWIGGEVSVRYGQEKVSQSPVGMVEGVAHHSSDGLLGLYYAVSQTA